jgi:flavin-dependent dehydrogenase
LALVEAAIANLCLVVRKKTLRAHHGWDGLFASIQNEVPALRDRLHGSAPCSPKPLAISPIPYGHLGGPADGIWRLGDQIAVIPSFTGDGMSIALHSAVLAAEMYLGGCSADDYTRCLVQQLRGGMRVATTLSRAMVTSGARIAAPFLLSIIPNAMGRIALSTRIPERALLTSQVNERAPFNQQPASIG